MEMNLTRQIKQPSCTLGDLEIDGKWFCNTLEPKERYLDAAHPRRKVKGYTAIPEGRYPVVITWSPRLKAWLPLLLHVPLFSGVRIHAGNTATDTSGCILVGRRHHESMLVDSRVTLDKLKQAIVEAKGRGEPVHITIRRSKDFPPLRGSSKG